MIPCFALASLRRLEGAGRGSLTQLFIGHCDITSLHGLAKAGTLQVKNLTLTTGAAHSPRSSGLSRLTHLDLHHSRALQSLDGLGTLPALVSLDLSGCGALTSLQPMLDAGEVSLRDVNVDRCLTSCELAASVPDVTTHGQKASWRRLSTY